MSRFLKIPEALFTPGLLHREVYFYVIEEFQSKIEIGEYPEGKDAENLVQWLIDKSTHKFRMYGSAQELLENVKIFAGFPQSHLFTQSFDVSYKTPPTIYYSLKNEKFIAKSDLFVILQNMIYGYFDSIVMPAMAVHLKAKEDKLGYRVEFVKFDETVLEQIEKEIKIIVEDKNTRQYINNVRSEAKKRGFDDLLQRANSAHPRIPPAEVGSKRYNQILQLYNTGKIDGVSPEMNALGRQVELIIVALHHVIEKRPEMFLPHSATKNNHQPITVRVFEDSGDQKFVLKSELSDALLAKRLISVPLVNEDSACHTIPMEQVLRNNYVKNIEFIRYPIRRAKHRMMPVKVYFNSSAIFACLAVDAFFEFVRETIFSLKLFQDPLSFLKLFEKSPTGQPDDVFSMQLYAVFKSEYTSPYFLSIEHTNTLKVVWKPFVQNEPKAEIRNVGNDGFTVENLKNELKHLGLTTTFPEIQNYAEIVYSEVVKRKKKEILRTCDLFDAIEHCVLISILTRLPELKTFLHNQNGCHRVYGYECKKCEVEQKKKKKNQRMSEIEKSSQSQNPDQKTEKNRKKKEKKKAKKLEQKMVEKNSGESQKTSESVEMDSEDFYDLKVSAESQIDDEESPENALESQKTPEILNEHSGVNKDDEPSLKDTNTESDYEPTSSESLTSESPSQKTSENVKIEEKPSQSFSAALRALKSKIHDQKTSKSVPHDPKSILEAQKPPDSESPNQKTSESVAIKENTFKPSTKGLDASESKNSNQKTSDDPKSVPTSKSSSTSDSANQKTSKESANCDKCYRTCEMLNETKKELKTMELKLEKLEKKKASKERELMELMTNEEKKMEEKEKEMENIRKQVLTLESSISEMRIENLRKEETFKERQKHLEDQISHLESELNEEKKKKKKTSELEFEILEKNRQIEEFKESEIRWKTENEVNQRMIQQLMDKLASSSGNNSSSYSTTNYSNPSGKDSGVVSSMTMTSTSSKIPKCEICWNEMTSQSAIQCQQCRRPFHQKCASNWLKNYKQCPSCNGEFQESTRNHFSSFF